MIRLQERAERIARAAERRRVAMLADRLAADLRGAEVRGNGIQVTIAGRGMLRRWLVDPGLRFALELGR